MMQGMARHRRAVRGWARWGVALLLLAAFVGAGSGAGTARAATPGKTAKPAPRAVAPRDLPVAKTFIAANTNDTVPRIMPVPPTCSQAADNCTLREALNASIANDPGMGNTNQITFTMGVTGTITLDQTLGTLTPTTNLVIQGPGQTALALDGGCTAGCGTATPTNGVRVLSVANGITLTVNDLTIQNGVATGTDIAGTGGGISLHDSDAVSTFNGTNLTFANNTANVTDDSGNIFFFGGGGLYTNNNATLTNVTFTNNYSAIYGGGAYIENYGTLINVALTNNQAGTYGGALGSNFPLTATNLVATGNTAGQQGGGIWTNDSISVTNALIANNQATAGNGLGGGFYGTAGNSSIYGRTFVNITVTGNSATGAYGGGGFWDAATTSVANSTFANNQAPNGIGGGIYIGDGGVFTATDITVSGNSAYSGGGIGLGSVMNPPQATLNDTIVAGNSLTMGAPRVEPRLSTNVGPDLYSTGVESFAGSYDIIGDGSGQGGAGGTLTNGTNNNRVGTTAQPFLPLLGPLGAYGSPALPGTGNALQTLPLLPGSAAIDSGGNCTTYPDPYTDLHTTPMVVGPSTRSRVGAMGTLTTDERGTGFPRVVGSACDVGAFETSGFTVTKGGDNQSTGIGQPFANPLSLTVMPVHAGDPVAGGVVGFVLIPGTASATFAASGGSSCAVTGMSLVAGCIIPMSGTVSSPTLTAGTTVGTLTATGSAAGALAANFTLTVTKNATMTTVTVMPMMSTVGSSVTLTATVSTTAMGVGQPTGTVTFSVGGTTLGMPVSLSMGTASLTTSLPVGNDTITATYSGDTIFAGSTGMGSATVTTNPTTTAVTVMPMTSIVGSSVTLTATVSTTAMGVGLPTGSVTFSVGGMNLGMPVSLSMGTASLMTTSLPVGNDTITATYSGDMTFAGSMGTGSAIVIPVQLIALNATVPAGPSSGNKGTATQPNIAPGQVLPLSVIGTYNNGTMGSVTTSLMYSVPIGSNVVSVSPSGVVTALSPGTVVVTITGPGGVTTTITITVSTATGAGLTNPQPMSHAAATVAAGSVQAQPGSHPAGGQGGAQPQTAGGTASATPAPQPARK